MKKILLIILIFLILLYLSICIFFSVLGNREIIYASGVRHIYNFRIYENGRVVIVINDFEKAETVIDKKEIKKLKKLILEDREKHSNYEYPTSSIPGVIVDKWGFSYGYYYDFFLPFKKNTVYDGKAVSYAIQVISTINIDELSVTRNTDY